jgi:hypothetical protein
MNNLSREPAGLPDAWHAILELRNRGHQFVKAIAQFADSRLAADFS